MVDRSVRRAACERSWIFFLVSLTIGSGIGLRGGVCLYGASPTASDQEALPGEEGEATTADTATSESADSGGETNDAARKTTKIATINVQGEMAEHVSQVGLLGELEQNLARFIARLDAAAKDEEIAAVVLRLRSPSIGRARTDELRAAIQRTRQAGKKVYAQMEMAAPADLLVASACDQIIMPESGAVILNGVRAEVTFLKGLLDKLNVHADILQVGDFKGAAEPLTRDGMSDAFRQQFEMVIEDYYQQMIETLASDRKLERSQVQKLIDTGLFTATSAQQAKLIDTIAYEHQMLESLKQQTDTDELEIVENYGKVKVDTEFSGLGGMVKLMELMLGAETSTSKSQRRKIAVVYATGAITSGKSSSNVMGQSSVGSDTMVEALQKAAKDNEVAAIVLRVDSPGGSALASDLIWRELRRIEKPVIASMGDVAASGGYYIAMGCDKIFAEPGTLTGSIGVVGGKVAIGAMWNKAGITTQVISRGANSGLFSTQAPFTDSERTVWRGMLEETYEQFTSKVALCRQMDRKQVLELAGGRIWTGRQAQSRGLVDRIGSLRDAIQEAKSLSGIGPDEKVELLLLPQPKSFFEQMIDDASVRTPWQSWFASSVSSSPLAKAALGPVADLQLVEELFREPTLFLLPFRLQIH